MKRGWSHVCRSSQEYAAERAWVAEARMKSARTRLQSAPGVGAAAYAWGGSSNVTIASTTGRARTIRAGCSDHTSRIITTGIMASGLCTHDLLDVRGVQRGAWNQVPSTLPALGPTYRVSLKQVGRLLLCDFAADLARVQSEVDAHLSSAAVLQSAESVLLGERKRGAARQYERAVQRMQTDWMPFLVKGGISEEEVIEAYRLAVARGVHES